MTRNIFVGTVFSAALAVGVAAQTGSPQTPQQTTPTAQEQGQQVTVVGCLQEGDMAKAPTGTAGTSGTGTAGTSGTQTARSQSEGQFVLTNARISSSPAGAAGTGTAGTSGTGTAGTAGSAANNKFVLVGGDEDELKRYANSQVEIRGRLDQSSASGRTGAASATGSPTGQTAQSSMDNARKLHVTSVKQIATSCTK